MATYKIGTRGSLLAVTQSTLIKNELERLTGESFELILIKTQGDEVTNKPLWQLEGKDFFTKELDEALLNGAVDFVIHSYKDLGSIRPEGIRLAAVTERRFAHDILIVPQEHITKLATWSGDFVVGTSSPRRIVNLQHSLKKFIPHSQKTNLRVTCETLRGNVNGRIKKLRDGKYHAITLALAGLERLAHTEKSAAEMAELLQGMNYFVLPQSVFPSAASQGALGIEMREDRDDHGKLATMLGKLTHALTVEEVLRERKAFKDFGGGCHLAVGIHVKKIGDTFLHVHAGEVDGTRIEKKWMEGVEYPQLERNKKLFIGLPSGHSGHAIYDEFIQKVPLTRTLDLFNKHVFVTSRYCLPSLHASTNAEGIWAAGTKTAEKLAEAGVWVNGTADSLGTDDLKALKTSKVLQMIHPHLKDDWTVLTHADSTSELGAVEGVYERDEKEVSPQFVMNLKHVGACYWTSYPQYQSYLQKFPFLSKSAHYCGLGKTWQEFARANVRVHPLAQMSDFNQLIP